MEAALDHATGTSWIRASCARKRRSARSGELLAAPLKTTAASFDPRRADHQAARRRAQARGRPPRRWGSRASATCSAISRTATATGPSRCASAELRLGEEATVEVEVIRAKVRPTRRRRLTILEADVRDASGQVKAIWFNRAWLADRLAARHAALPARQAREARLQRRRARVPRLIARRGLHTTGIVPVHPASERLRPQRIREWVWQAIPQARHAVEPIPGRLRRELRLAGAAGRAGRLALPCGRARRRGGAGAPRLRGALPLPGGAGLPPRPACLR